MGRLQKQSFGLIMLMLAIVADRTGNFLFSEGYYC